MDRIVSSVPEATSTWSFGGSRCDGLVLEEAAPGFTPQEIADLTDAPPIIGPDVAEMG